jgi:signal transduction histidine kinase
VQEALTNALRHGNPDSPVELIVAWRQDALELVITNSRRHDDPGTEMTGHGIVGMIERATLVGGSVAAHAVDDSFVVVASIPIRRNDVGGSPL